MAEIGRSASAQQVVARALEVDAIQRAVRVGMAGRTSIGGTEGAPVRREGRDRMCLVQPPLVPGETPKASRMLLVPESLAQQRRARRTLQLRVRERSAMLVWLAALENWMVHRMRLHLAARWAGPGCWLSI